MRKRYEVKGMMEWHPVFLAGRSRVQVSFTGGHLCGGGNTPAVYETSDLVVQTVIEKSEAFRSGKIRMRVLDQDIADKTSLCMRSSVKLPGRIEETSVAEAPAPVSEGFKPMEFSCEDAAVDFLHYEKGVALELLLDKESCIEEGRKLGIDVKFKSVG